MKSEALRLARVHVKTLSIKRLQNRWEDHYGKTIDKKWSREVKYFYDQIIVPCYLEKKLPYVENIKDEWRRGVEHRFRGGLASWGNADLLEERMMALCAREQTDPANVEPIEVTFLGRVRLFIDELLDAYDSHSPLEPVDIENLSPIEFESHCARILNANGWKASMTKGSGDQGIDIIASKRGKRAVFQCKKYWSPVGNKAVQEVHGGKAHESADLAFVVSNATFTPKARELAATTRVHLIHYTELADLDRYL